MNNQFENKATALAFALCERDFFGIKSGLDLQKSVTSRAINIVERLRLSGWSTQKASNELRLGKPCNTWSEVEDQLALTFLWAAQVGYKSIKEVRHGQIS